MDFLARSQREARRVCSTQGLTSSKMHSSRAVPCQATTSRMTEIKRLRFLPFCDHELDAGSRLVPLSEPDSLMVHCYRSRQDIQVLKASEWLDASDAVPEWRVQVADLLP